MKEIEQTIERIMEMQDRMINHMDSMIKKMDNMILLINESRKQEPAKKPKKGRNSFKKQWIKWAQ